MAYKIISILMLAVISMLATPPVYADEMRVRIESESELDGSNAYHLSAGYVLPNGTGVSFKKTRWTDLLGQAIHGTTVHIGADNIVMPYGKLSVAAGILNIEGNNTTTTYVDWTNSNKNSYFNINHTYGLIGNIKSINKNISQHTVEFTGDKWNDYYGISLTASITDFSDGNSRLTTQIYPYYTVNDFLIVGLPIYSARNSISSENYFSPSKYQRISALAKISIGISDYSKITFTLTSGVENILGTRTDVSSYKIDYRYENLVLSYKKNISSVYWYENLFLTYAINF